MRPLLHFPTALLSLCLFTSWAFAQELIAPLSNVSYELATVSDSGVTGQVMIADYDLGGTLVVIALKGLDATQTYPAHFHSGDCGSGGSIAVPLEPVNGASGLSVSLTSAAYDAITQGNHYLNIHNTPDDMGTILACAEVGEGASGVAAQRTEDSGGQMDEDGATATQDTATGVRPEEFETSLRTAGYGIFAVEGSGLSGQAQVAETAEDGVRVTVTLDNVTPGQQYRAVLRAGDCGPDGETLLELNTVPNAESENASVTETDLTFDDIAESNNYLHIYPAESDTVLACGEIGTGANR